MDIERKELLNNLISLIKRGHLLLIGDPGIGKSWLVEKLYNKINEENIPNKFIHADSIITNILLDFKSVLNFKNRLSLEDNFNYKSNGKRSILIIDALDAARGEAKQSVYREFINLVLEKCPDWFVLATIRTYDAKYSHELLSLFPSGNTDVPEEFRIPEVKYRHLLVPFLSEEEIYTVLDQIIPLKEVYRNATIDQKELFKIPFDLWIMEQLIQEGIPLEKLSNVQDVVQLFGYYWNFRIDAKKDSKKREAILKKAVTAMVKSNNLTVNIKFLRTPKRLDTYESLLSDQVLRVSSDSENLALFNHNILFDYAVSKLLIKEIPEEAYRFLTRGPSRPVFIRPSIDYFFARLWFDNRKLFWEVFWYFLYQKKEEYLHLMPMLCLVNEIQYLGDFQPILDKLKNKNSLKYQFYLLMLKRIFQTLKSIKKDIIPERDNVWIEILFKLNSFLSVKFIDEYLRLLANAINKWSDWQRDEQNKIAFMSRAILWWAWEPPSELNQRQIKKLHEVVAVWGVPLVCKTYTENPKESKELLSKILFRLGPTSTISEIYILVQEIERIWSCDPEFAVQIYKAVFSYEEKSEEKTLMTEEYSHLQAQEDKIIECAIIHLLRVSQNF